MVRMVRQTSIYSLLDSMVYILLCLLYHVSIQPSAYLIFKYISKKYINKYISKQAVGISTFHPKHFFVI